MSCEANKRVLQRWIFEVWAKGNYALADQLASPSYIFHTPGQPDLHGPDAMKQFISMYRMAFPDLTNTIHAQIAEGDMVMTRGTARGTHLAALGPMPASGKSVAVDWMILSRFDGDRIAEEYELFDALGMMQQISAIPVPA
jgi:steroid delta-isomerase-like uncharacterized protein